MKNVAKNKEELILLDSDENGINHNFQNSIFKERIEKHLKDYEAQKGEYQ
jgi:hypothetical protein